MSGSEICFPPGAFLSLQSTRFHPQAPLLSPPLAGFLPCVLRLIVTAPFFPLWALGGAVESLFTLAPPPIADWLGPAPTEAPPSALELHVNTSSSGSGRLRALATPVSGRRPKPRPDF